jgi:hypothetical protein
VTAVIAVRQGGGEVVVVVAHPGVAMSGYLAAQAVARVSGQGGGSRPPRNPPVDAVDDRLTADVARLA